MKKLLTTLALSTFIFHAPAFSQSGDTPMQTHMQQMNALMEQIKSEQNEDRLAELMSQHMQLMHEGMAMMDMSASQESQLTQEERLERMEQRMQMMQMMMNQMMQHEEEEQRRPIHQHRRR